LCKFRFPCVLALSGEEVDKVDDDSRGHEDFQIIVFPAVGKARGHVGDLDGLGQAAVVPRARGRLFLLFCCGGNRVGLEILKLFVVLRGEKLACLGNESFLKESEGLFYLLNTLRRTNMIYLTE
jgi:hypothetical protein